MSNIDNGGAVFLKVITAIFFPLQLFRVGIAINDFDIRAIKERIISYVGHTTADGDGRQTSAIIEGIIADARHAIRDGD